jgi:hypothetical protein
MKGVLARCASESIVAQEPCLLVGSVDPEATAADVTHIISYVVHLRVLGACGSLIRLYMEHRSALAQAFASE